MDRVFCGNCRYFEYEQTREDSIGLDQKVSECRYNPPVVMFNGDYAGTYFPNMSYKEWCGKWEKRTGDGETPEEISRGFMGTKAEGVRL